MTVELWKVRLQFALFLGAGGFLMPYLALYFQQVGLTGAQMGLLTALGWAVSMLTAPVWGRWSDTARNPKAVLQIALLGAGAANLVLGLQNTFLGIAFFVGLGSVFDNAISALSTRLALAITQAATSGFGSVRLFGSLGWAAAAPVAGWLIERTGLFVPFAGYAVCAMGAAIVLAFIRPPAHGDPQAGQPARIPLRRVAAVLSRDRSMLGLAGAMFVVWLSTAGRFQFESIYMTELGAPESLIGLSTAFGAVIEPPFMLLADRLIRRFGSGPLLQVGLLLQGLGIGLVALTPSVASLFALRALEGIPFSLLTIALVAYVVEGAPAGQEATYLSLYEVTLHGLVILVASPLAGLFFDTLGAHGLYLIALAGTLLGLVILRATVRPFAPKPTPVLSS